MDWSASPKNITKFTTIQMLFAVLGHNKRPFSLNTEKQYVLIQIKVFCIVCIFAVKYVHILFTRKCATFSCTLDVRKYARGRQ